MSYEDPRGRDPRFPDRPRHQDFIDLSDVAQGNDMRAEAGTPIPEIVGLDTNSLMYFIRERFGVLSQATGVKLDPNNLLLMSLYLDALAIGKHLAEHRARKKE